MILNKSELLNTKDIIVAKLRADLLCALQDMLGEINSERVIENALKNIEMPAGKRKRVISLGKAAVAMYRGASRATKIQDAFIATNKPCPDLMKKECIQSSHPLPDENSIKAGKRLFEIVKNSTESEFLLFLISGGTSSIVELPLISLEDTRKTTAVLLESGLDIRSINCIRKHISAIKGGKLLRNLKSQLLCLVISDVIGDDLSSIGSGLTYYDESTTEDALNIIKNHKLEMKLPESVLNLLRSNNPMVETLKKHEFPDNRVKNIIAMNNPKAVKVLARSLKSRGYRVTILDKPLTGDVKDAVRVFEKLLGLPAKSAVIAGGEITVKVTGKGKGGRNQEFALNMLKIINNRKLLFCAFATDGADGNTRAAGAFADSETKRIAELLKLKIDHYLINNDSHTFFRKTKSCIFTEDTLTNLADLYILMSP